MDSSISRSLESDMDSDFGLGLDMGTNLKKHKNGLSCGYVHGLRYQEELRQRHSPRFRHELEYGLKHGALSRTL